MIHFRNMTPIGASSLPPTLCSHSRIATSVVRGSGCGASADSNLIGNGVHICSSGIHRNNPSDHDLQRANGSVRILLSGSERGTRLVDVFQQSPIRILFPNTDRSAVEEAVLINTGGGIAGGDRLDLSVTALGDASIAVTSQAAEKVYRALSEPARISTKLKAGESARLAWLPQETILFNRARLKRETEVDLSSGAELLALEWLVLGRAAHGEELTGGCIVDSWRVRKDGRLIWADTFRITDEIFPYLHRKALLGDCRAVGTLIYFGPGLDKWKNFIRESTPSSDCYCAVSSVGDLIILRFAAKESSALRRVVRIVLQKFGQEPVPGPFRVPKMWSC
jgi:urease accessory protein